MMIIDHIAFGILNGSVYKGENRKRVLAWSIFFSILPDLSAFIFPIGTINYLSHRAFTHSILLMPFYVFIPLIIYQLVFRKYNLKTFFTVYLFGLTSFFLHIILDLITIFGINLWFPISKRIDSLDFIHEFEPIFMTISLVVIASFVICFIKRKYIPRKIVIIFFSIYFLYILSNYLIVDTMTNKFKAEITNINKDAQYLRTIPMTFWRWKGIAKDRDNYFVIKFENKKYTIKEYPISEENKLREKIIYDENV